MPSRDTKLKRKGRKVEPQRTAEYNPLRSLRRTFALKLLIQNLGCEF